MVCLIVWALNIIVFTPRDEHSQGERPHSWLHQRDCTYKLMIKYLLFDDDDLIIVKTI